MLQVLQTASAGQWLGWPCSVGALMACGGVLLAVRLWLVGARTPVFARADNPAAHAASWATRTLTFFHLPAINLRLLLWPGTLSFDWSMDAVALVESAADPRNAQSLALYAALAVLVRRSLSALAHPAAVIGQVRESHSLVFGRLGKSAKDSQKTDGNFINNYSSLTFKLLLVLFF